MQSDCCLCGFKQSRGSDDDHRKFIISLKVCQIDTVDILSGVQERCSLMIAQAVSMEFRFFLIVFLIFPLD